MKLVEYNYEVSDILDELERANMSAETAFEKLTAAAEKAKAAGLDVTMGYSKEDLENRHGTYESSYASSYESSY